MTKNTLQDFKVLQGVFIENMDFNTPNQFGHDLILGFKQMAESEGWTVDVIPTDMEFQRMTPYDVFMMQEGYQASFVLGFSLPDPWMQEFRTSRIPAVLYDNYIKGNPRIASVGCDSQEGFELAVRNSTGSVPAVKADTGKPL